MDRKFCTSCQTLQPTELVKLVQTGKVKRWKCTTCLAGKSVGPYKGKKNEKVNTRTWRDIGPEC